MNIIENNQVKIIGEISSDFSFSHEIFGEEFYIVDVRVARLSDSCDIIPVMVSGRVIDVSSNCKGLIVRVDGQFRSFNKREEGKNRLLLSVFAQEIEFVDETPESAQTNQIFLDGYICKEPIYRKTPLGREIADLLIAVNRHYGKSDYIPSICWGRNAIFASNLEIGTRISISGRIQSRNYIKKYEDGSTEERTSYEVSVQKLEVVKDAD